MEDELAGLTINEEEDAILQVQLDPNTKRGEEIFRVLKGSQWTSNNHLLVLHKLQWGEDPLKIPLFMVPFWVQIHDVPIGLFSENLSFQLGNFVGEFIEYDGLNLGKENRNYMRFKYERLSLFYFYCGRLGHNDSFCEAKMALGVEVAEMGWDLSLRAQSQRAATMNSVWLREEGEGKLKEDGEGVYMTRNNLRTGENKIAGYGKALDPVLGFSLEGRKIFKNHRVENLMSDRALIDMEHDLEDDVLIGEEGKKGIEGRWRQ
ncbi:hypothetical protein Gotri_007596 [Gossypium trilobum]|uniref:Zinc knuckle CX2CX4HX4C domain-containing protein n=1 Tax=Gossypium trilobum TaxID=34281 RepID=A0A7J9EGN3_9ROSI|nr:hypothetical protein [Gossypium trilobum]